MPDVDTAPDPEGSEFARFLRTETLGGSLLFVVAIIAVAWANSPWSGSYDAMRDVTFGPETLHLHLSLETWVRDGLLAIFFFVIGLELKRELVVGELADRRSATFPVFAALGGVVVPAAIAASIMWGEPGASRAWAIPTATDIAFALGVLAIFGSALPVGVRTLLLALAVVDDLVAIILIAVLFSDGIDLLLLAGFVACAAAWWLAQRQRIRTPALYVPLALVAWGLLHGSGVHATIAGVVLGVLTRVRADPHEQEAPALRLEHLLQPWSATAVVPVFALFAAGVSFAPDDLRAMASDPIAIGVAAGLLAGKWVGIVGGALLAERLGVAHRPDGVTWGMVNAVAILGGVGFTVALLVADLALPAGESSAAKASVLITSILAAALGAIAIRAAARSSTRRNG